MAEAAMNRRGFLKGLAVAVAGAPLAVKALTEAEVSKATPLEFTEQILVPPGVDDFQQYAEEAHMYQDWVRKGWISKEAYIARYAPSFEEPAITVERVRASDGYRQGLRSPDVLIDGKPAYLKPEALVVWSTDLPPDVLVRVQEMRPDDPPVSWEKVADTGYAFGEYRVRCASGHTVNVPFLKDPNYWRDHARTSTPMEPHG